jgi:hypothetical protein
MPPAEDDAALERALTRKLYRKDCPRPEILGEMHLGSLPEGPSGADTLTAKLRSGAWIGCCDSKTGSGPGCGERDVGGGCAKQTTA